MLTFALPLNTGGFFSRQISRQISNNLFYVRSFFMSRRGENIYKRKDRRWEGRYIKSRKRMDRSTMAMSMVVPIKKRKRNSYLKNLSFVHYKIRKTVNTIQEQFKTGRIIA